MGKKPLGKTISVIAALLALLIHVSCVTGRYLKAEPAREIDSSGSYALILYGSGLTRLAILDRADDGFVFSMTESGYSYERVDNVPAQEAVRRAMSFISSHRSRWRRITDEKGNIAGYELRPVFNIMHYGSSHMLNVDYRVDGGNVRVMIDLKETVRKKLEHDDFGGD